MIAALAGLLLCQLLGEVLVRGLLLPIPGPVAGLGLMFAVLVFRGRRRRTGAGRANGESDEPSIPVELARVCDALLANLSLLFIPAAVGVVQYLGLLRAYAGPIAIAIVASTTAALVVTAVTFRLVSRLVAFRRKPLLADIEAAIDPAHHP